MKRPFVILGMMIVMGAIYWWQLQVIAYMGDGALNYSFACIVSGGYRNCPFFEPDLRQANLQASIAFYIGVFLLLYLMIFSNPPRMPRFNYTKRSLSGIFKRK